MHFTGTLYRSPSWPTWPLLQITQGCSHNKCKFCTMYRDVKFAPMPIEIIEEDLAELSQTDPDATTIQLLSGNPLALPFHRLKPILEKIHEYLPHMEHIYTQGRITDLRSKSVEQLRELRDLGMDEISIGVESGDDWTLERVVKGYRGADVVEQCHKLDEAGIRYWLTYLNGVAGRSHMHEHALNSARVFNQCHPMHVGVGGFTLFPGTPLRDEAERGEFDPLTEAEMLEELREFALALECDCAFSTHHNVVAEIDTQDFLADKDAFIAEIDDILENDDMELLAQYRAAKTDL